MSSLKDKTVSGLFWTWTETIASQLVNFLAMLVLARLVIPDDFGLIAMCAIFIAMAQVFIDGGFVQALVRKQNCADCDYSTVFWINISMGVLLYAFMFVTAPFIAHYFEQPALTQIIRVLMLVLPLNALTLIHRTILIKQFKFRLQAVISLIGIVVGFGVSVGMAWSGYGVWSIVAKQLSTQFVMMCGFWFTNKWRPQYCFSRDSFRELFGFGSKLLAINFLAVLFNNIYKTIIGKVYNARELGFYSNADSMAGVLSNSFTVMLNRAAYNTLSRYQHDDVEFKRVLRQLMEPLYYPVFCIFCTCAVMSSALIPLLLGTAWQRAAFFFSFLCIAYMATIMHTVNQMIMNVKGRSDYFLKTELIKYALFVPVVWIGVRYGINALVIGFVVHYWLGFPINALYSKRLIDYGFWEQLKDMASPMAFALTVAAVVWLISLVPTSMLWLTVLLQGCTALLTAWILVKIFKIKAYDALCTMLHKLMHLEHTNKDIND